MKTQLRSADEELRLRAQSPTPNKAQHSPLPGKPTDEPSEDRFDIPTLRTKIYKLTQELSVQACKAAHADKLAEALRKCVSYLADLNGQNWIKGEDIITTNFKLKAQVLQKQTYKALAAYEEAKQ